ncbi:ionotropic receptor 93a-like [Panulirus ornatus]|uniref:ionotropic receptor 93a-like n=1 Tax=Panulirus ornatus TaxID=150431 RepID=UPI003A88D3FB
MANEIDMLFDRSVYVYLPYSPRGAQLLRVASWTPNLGLRVIGQASLFPEKFANFHGATVNITALPFAPYWIQIKEEAPNGSIVERLTGTDYLMLRAIANTLNFTTYNIPTNSWDEVALRVEERLSFISPVFHMMLPQRAARYDFSFEYEYAALSFSLTKPGLKPQWQNLYYPLSGEVWVATLVAFVVMSASFIMVSRALMSDKKLEVSQAVLETLGILMEENLSKRLPRSNSGRVLLAGWLIFAFIIGTIYRGNLTAALTLPKYPPRPETLEQLVSYVDRVTMPPHGDEFRRFFLSSNSPVFQKLGQMMDLVPTITDGIKLALHRK